MNIINEDNLNSILKSSNDPSPEEILSILKKAKLKKGLSLEETAKLLQIKDEGALQQLYKTARQIKNDIYGERLVLFAPFYISNYCVNDCDYCAFHSRNPVKRKRLSLKEVEEQVKILEDLGHKRLLLEFGEHPTESPIDYVIDVIKTIYKTKSGNGEIRRVNVNIAATTVEDYKKLKDVGIGTYQLFQETYHQETYQQVHKGPKANYERQLYAHDRAIEAGIDDFGIGVLFGLYDYKFEVLALLSHAQYLEKTYGIGPHTISVPRLQPASTVDMKLPYEVKETKLLKIIAILRLAVPYTGMILSTRENPEIRKKAFELGISQTSAGSKTTPGGYTKSVKAQNLVPLMPPQNLVPPPPQEPTSKSDQFSLADHRSLDENIESILDQELLPSFCTACYRKGRTGEAFMDIAKPGEIHHLCRPNGLLTFKEYLEDYASPEVKRKGNKIIKKYLDIIENPARKKETVKRLSRLEKGERDLYF